MTYKSYGTYRSYLSIWHNYNFTTLALLQILRLRFAAVVFAGGGLHAATAAFSGFHVTWAVLLHCRRHRTLAVLHTGGFGASGTCFLAFAGLHGFIAITCISGCRTHEKPEGQNKNGFTDHDRILEKNVKTGLFLMTLRKNEQGDIGIGSRG